MTIKMKNVVIKMITITKTENTFTTEVETVMTRNMNTKIKFRLHNTAVELNVMTEVTQTRLERLFYQTFQRQIITEDRYYYKKETRYDRRLNSL